MVRVRDCDFSYIIPPLDGDKRKDFSTAVKTFTFKNKHFCEHKLFLLSTTNEQCCRHKSRLPDERILIMLSSVTYVLLSVGDAVSDAISLIIQAFTTVIQ